MIVAAVVLAAGASTRMGRPKALIEWRGRTFVAHVVAQARAAACSPILVVQGAVPLPPLEPARIVINEAWSKGQMSSLRCGLEVALAEEPDGIVVLTVDRPHIAPATVAAVVEAWRSDPGGIWQPRHDARRGHPLVYPADAARDLVALDAAQTQRTFLARPEVASRRRTLDVDDPAVLQNLDRPQDLEGLPGLR